MKIRGARSTGELPRPKPRQSALDLPALQKVLQQSLETRQKRRAGKTPEEWHRGEMNWMCFEVNSRRRSLGKDLLVLDEIAHVERLACGHSDYAHKFALYCAELVLAD